MLDKNYHKASSEELSALISAAAAGAISDDPETVSKIAAAVLSYRNTARAAIDAGARFYVSGLDSSRADETAELAERVISYILEAEEYQSIIEECEDIENEWGTAAADKHWERSKIGRNSDAEWNDGPAALIESVLSPLDLSIWVNRRDDNYIAELQICWGGPGITAEYDSRYSAINIRACWGAARVNVELNSGALYEALQSNFEAAYSCEIDC